MTENQTSEDQQGQADHDVDRYPTWERLLTRLRGAELVPEGQVSRVEIECGAGGDVTYRYWEARSEEYEFSYIGPDSG